MALTQEAIRRVLGPVDNATMAEIAATGASEEELARARAWVHSDDVLMDEGRHVPSGRVARLIEILQPEPDPE